MSNAHDHPLVSVLFGYAPTPLKAAQIAETYRDCPFCISYKSSGRSVTGVFATPPDRRWWLDWVVDDPVDTVGLESAALFYPREVTAHSPWTRGQVQPDRDRPPCQADCRECSRYGGDCRGCPATRFFLGGRDITG
jgi:hypothetical protein